MAEAVPPTETRKSSPSPPGSPNFSGRWRLAESVNFDPFLKDCNVGYLKRQVAGMVTSEHHISQEGNNMAVEVTTTGRGSKHQVYEIGDKFIETEINGEEAVVNTEWDGETIKERHRTPSFEYELVRTLPNEDTMVLRLESEKGTKAERIYKKSGA